MTRPLLSALRARLLRPRALHTPTKRVLAKPAVENSGRVAPVVSLASLARTLPLREVVLELLVVDARLQRIELLGDVLGSLARYERPV